MGGFAIPNINFDPRMLANIQRGGRAGLSTTPGSGAVSARDFAPNVPGAGTAYVPPAPAPAAAAPAPSIPPATPSPTAGYTGLAAEGLTGDRDFDSQILAARDAQDAARARETGTATGLTPEEYQASTEQLGEFLNLPENVAYRQTGGGLGLGDVLSIAAGIAIPFAAPAIAGAIGASAALGATAGSALTGAALGAGKAAIFDEDIATGALLGGVSGGVAGALGGAGAGTEAAGAAAGGPQPLTMAELVGGTSPAAGTVNIGAGLPGGSLAAAAPSITAGAPLTAANVFGGAPGATGGLNVGLVDTLTQQAAANLTGAAAAGAPLTAVAPGAVNLGAGLAPDVAAALPAPATTTLVPSTTAPVPEIIPEVSPFETAGGEFVQTSAPQQSPVTTPSIDQTLTGAPTPAGTYDPATGLTGYIDQSGQFVQTASPVGTPTGLEMVSGAPAAATIAQSPVFGVTDLAAPTFGATAAMTAPIAGSVAGAATVPSLLAPASVQTGVTPEAALGAQEAFTAAGGTVTPEVAAVQQQVAQEAALSAAGITPQEMAEIEGAIPSAGSAAPALSAVDAAAGGGALAAAGEYLGDVASGVVSGATEAFTAENVADTILRAGALLAADALAGGGDGGASALAGLSAEEQALVLEMRDELARVREQDANLFNQRLQQAYALIGDVDYFDPEYFGLQSARRAQLQAARAKRAGLRGLTGEERAAEERRFDLETGRSAGTAYDVGYGTGLEARTRARQAGIEAMPTFYPSALSELSTLQDIYRGGSARAAQAQSARRERIGNLFGGLVG